MAQKFGGKFSPEGGTDASRVQDRGTYRGARRTRAGGRVNLLFIAPLPLVYGAFTTGPAGLAMNLAALGLMLLAAWLTREGIVAQEAYESRKIARRPAVPRKMAGSLSIGLGLGLAGYAASGGLAAPVIYALAGMVLHGLAFGIDPMKDKGVEGVDMFQTERVARAVDQAEERLREMTSAIRGAGDRALERRVERFCGTARDLFRTVEEDPRDLTAARKYLSVYLLGARDATVRFAEIYNRRPDPQARADYEALLDDLEGNFAARTEKLLNDDRSDLDIEISVLRDRLKREGVRPD
ncbi:hypothetical protein DQW77_13835 [Roseovarius sp. TE539]|uniref:5-bromo-4-chloroindolyl phosphate hydrolysis family protein n=1 Tax=Roseovarius sp. TE539 TaxID=2249812 RepID=UPI000DDC66A3|nr:5-bromo-4-chloroindolyl phosphate hydrolysis family protein [Roseovarius sp. TE539]RBI70528.1 hypothetical protein DQW77_13835 [Roseovarius sp. TE539]